MHFESRPPTPWGEILTSIPVWAAVVTIFAEAWGYFTIQTCIPLFMYDVLGFSTARNGIVSAIPLLLLCALNPLLGFLSDWLRAPGRMSTKFVRKFFVIAGLAVSGCGFIFITYTDCNRPLTVLLVCLTFSGTATPFPNVAASIHDLAPLHAGKLMGMALTGAAISMTVGPLVVGAVTSRHAPLEGWRIVFFICAAMYAFGAVVFFTFGSVERQTWAEAIGDDYTVKLQSTNSTKTGDSS